MFYTYSMNKTIPKRMMHLFIIEFKRFLRRGARLDYNTENYEHAPNAIIHHRVINLTSNALWNPGKKKTKHDFQDSYFISCHHQQALCERHVHDVWYALIGYISFVRIYIYFTVRLCYRIDACFAYLRQSP